MNIELIFAAERNFFIKFISFVCNWRIKMKMSFKDIVVVGGTICALFFGSGNIVLPLMIGQSAGSCWVTSYIGFITGAVLLPFLGLVAISLRDGSYKIFFESIGTYILNIVPIKKNDTNKRRFENFGKGFAVIITFIVLAIMGPFGVVPRCLTVAEGGFHAIGRIPDYLFYLITIFLLWGIVCKKDQVMPTISKILTPIKLTLLIGVVAVCLIMAPNDQLIISPSSTHGLFSSGLVMGYQTLDLLGAIFCGTIIIDYIKSIGQSNSKADVLKFSILSGIIGCIILSVIYLGFTILSVNFSGAIQNVKPEDIFITIANAVLGKHAAAIVGLTMIISCLTTAVALITVWSTFVTDLINTRFKINYQVVLVISLAITYGVSLLGLERILQLLAPVLEFSYPLVLTITLINIFVDIVGIKKEQKLSKVV